MAPKRKASESPLSPAPPCKSVTVRSIADDLERLAMKPVEAPADSMMKTCPEICQSLEQDSQQSTPRFLFRAWDHSSGGKADLNRETAITPLAFHAGAHQPPMWHHSRDVIGLNAQKHLCGARTSTSGDGSYRTFFSSWSQSLVFVMSLAKSKNSKTSFISIVDTKALSEENIILYTPKMRKISSYIPSHFSEEFLIYGIVRGSAHKAVALRDIVHYNLYDLAKLHLETAISQAQKIGNAFGPKFSLAVATYLLAPIKVDIRTIVERLAQQPVPEEWVDDFLIISRRSYDTGGMPDTNRAISFLRAITLYSLRVENIALKGQVAKLLETRSQDNEELEAEITSLADEDAQEDEKAARAAKSIADSDRLSQVTKDLYIAMIGWGPANQASLARTRQQTKAVAVKG